MTTNRPSTTAIPQSAPAGGLLITQPPQTAISFFKIAPNQPITFGWNMTSVLATPTHLTASAICDNGNTYPVGPSDGILPGTASGVVWDLYKYQTENPNKPLAQATYTLHVWDDRGPGAARRAGYLAENNQLRFALYTPQAYTPLASWNCAACSSSMGWSTADVTHPAFVSLMVTFFIVFFSGYHLIRSGARSRNN